MDKKIARQLCEYHVGVPDKIEKPVSYIMAGNGIMEVRRNEIGTFCIKTDKIAGLDNIREGIQMSIPKIPFSMLMQIISYFRAVNEKYKSEAIVQIFWDRTKKQYFINPPDQEVSGAHVDFKRDPTMEKDHLLVMDIHSHNTMGAFFSGTDDGDEKETRFFGVIGKITDDWPEMKFRACVAGKAKDAGIAEIFDVAEGFPVEWMSKIKEKKYTVTYFGNAYQGATGAGDDWWNKDGQHWNEWEKTWMDKNKGKQKNKKPGLAEMTTQELINLIKSNVDDAKLQDVAHGLLEMGNPDIPRYD